MLSMRFKFAFCSKGMKTIQTIKNALFFDVIPINNVNNFFTYDNVIPFETIKKKTSFSRFELCFEI